MAKQTFESEFEVQYICGQGINDDDQTVYFVKWIGYTQQYNTWQPLQNLTNCKSTINKWNKYKYKQLKQKRMKYHQQKIQIVDATKYDNISSNQQVVSFELTTKDHENDSKKVIKQKKIIKKKIYYLKKDQNLIIKCNNEQKRINNHKKQMENIIDLENNQQRVDLRNSQLQNEDTKCLIYIKDSESDTDESQIFVNKKLQTEQFKAGYKNHYKNQASIRNDQSNLQRQSKLNKQNKKQQILLKNSDKSEFFTKQQVYYQIKKKDKIIQNIQDLNHNRKKINNGKNSKKQFQYQDQSKKKTNINNKGDKNINLIDISQIENTQNQKEKLQKEREKKKVNQQFKDINVFFLCFDELQQKQNKQNKINKHEEFNNRTEPLRLIKKSQNNKFFYLIKPQTLYDEQQKNFMKSLGQVEVQFTKKANNKQNTYMVQNVERLYKSTQIIQKYNKQSQIYFQCVKDIQFKKHKNLQNLKSLVGLPRQQFLNQINKYKTQQTKRKLILMIKKWNQSMNTTHKEYAKPQDIPAILQLLAENNEWLKNQGAYSERIEMINSKVLPIKQRYDNFHLILDKIEYFLVYLDCNQQLINSLETQYAHITPEERQQSLNFIERCRSWIRNAQQKQGAKQKWQEATTSITDHVKKTMGKTFPKPAELNKEKVTKKMIKWMYKLKHIIYEQVKNSMEIVSHKK